LSNYNYDVIYRKGSQNLAADAVSRCCSATQNKPSLKEIHEYLCHPGTTRLWHYVKSRNLPYSIDDVRKICNMCHICRELKPRFHKPPGAHIIKSTKPFKRISIDFMGSKHSSSQNKYILTVIDEYSRFPFLFLCPDLMASTVMNCLSMLFTMFGLPESVHSDRGTNFMSAEVTNYLAKMGINQTRTSPYHPQGNDQSNTKQFFFNFFIIPFKKVKKSEISMCIKNI